jgi:pimeloyl-ACP methyl ester carboxylesterase
VGIADHTDMPRVCTNGIEIEYETFGDPSAEPLLLIMGLGAQMILWEGELCGLLAGRGHYVIRFDNRDVGLSTRLEEARVPRILAMMDEVARGERPEAPYRLSDMALDAVGLLDGLGIDAAHVLGASMGGMIAQTIAIEHPDRVRTLTSVMSSTEPLSRARARPEAIQALLTPLPKDRERNIERAVEVARIIGSPGFPLNEDRIRARAARSYDRGFYPKGLARQLAAILASGSRRNALAAVRAPTLVIHGDADPLVPVESGIDTAGAVPGAELLIIEGMGHDLPPEIWPRFVDATTRHTRKALRAG